MGRDEINPRRVAEKVSLLAAGLAVVTVAFSVLLGPSLAALDDDECLRKSYSFSPPAAAAQQQTNLLPPQVRCTFQLASGETAVQIVEPHSNGYIVGYAVAVLLTLACTAVCVIKIRRRAA